MAQTVSIQSRGNGQYVITDSDGQTRIVNQSQANAESAKSGVKVINNPTPNPSAGPSANGYQNNAGANYPSLTEKTVLMPDSKTGKMVPTNVSDAIAQAYNAKNLGKIRENLLKYGQLTKAEARDPNNLLNKWSAIVYGAANDTVNNEPFKYAAALQKQGFGSTTTDTTPKPYTQVTELDPTKARSLVESAFVQELHRQPSPEEITNWTNKLVAKVKSTPVKTTYGKDKAGNTVVTQGTGLDEGQFLQEELRKTKEYSAVKQSGLDTAMQKVRNAAMANAYPLSNEDALRYAEQIRLGVSPDEISSIFRRVAAVTQPKNVADLLNSGIDLSTIYQPYKNIMASTLEINPNDIKLDDPALGRAIQGDKALTTYEFQRELRRDPRWEYTDNARSEAASVATKVLKDFGFMG